MKKSNGWRGGGFDQYFSGNFSVRRRALDRRGSKSTDGNDTHISSCLTQKSGAGLHDTYLDPASLEMFNSEMWKVVEFEWIGRGISP